MRTFEKDPPDGSVTLVVPVGGKRKQSYFFTDKDAEAPYPLGTNLDSHAHSLRDRL